MQMDTRIPQMGQQPDFVNTLARSTQAAQLANQNRDQNALRQLFQAQGPQIMAGEGNALNALAQIDPNAALGIKSTQQDMTIQRERLGLAREASAREAARYAMALEEGQRQKFKEATRALVGMLSVAKTTEQFEQAKQRAAAQYPGFDMSQYTFDDLPMVVAELEGAAAGFDLIERRNPVQKPADEYQRYVQEEAQAGRKPLSRIEFAKAKQKQSRISVSPDGTVMIAEGDTANDPSWGKAASNQIDERILNSGAMLSRLNDTNALFKPEYLEFATRIGVEWGKFKDKMGTASPEQQALVAEFARFKTEAFNNLNTGLKELSGAAVTPQEAERLLEQLPSVGTGVFDGDSPIEFKAKMEQAIKQQKLAVARYNLWRVMGQTGNPWDMGSLDSVPDMMNKRGAQIMEDLRKQGLTDEKVIFDMAEKQLREETGL